mmetsp:Transcript_48603/g.141599  ORF Transcript_48603/g.141599 Transcript_48603/m.141599 type:complete len:245 (+) Transcript_48603:1990-2724(+)
MRLEIDATDPRKSRLAPGGALRQLGAQPEVLLPQALHLAAVRGDDARDRHVESLELASARATGGLAPGIWPHRAAAAAGVSVVSKAGLGGPPRLVARQLAGERPPGRHHRGVPVLRRLVGRAAMAGDNPVEHAAGDVYTAAVSAGRAPGRPVPTHPAVRRHGVAPHIVLRAHLMHDAAAGPRERRVLRLLRAAVASEPEKPRRPALASRHLPAVRGGASGGDGHSVIGKSHWAIRPERAGRAQG